MIDSEHHMQAMEAKIPLGKIEASALELLMRKQNPPGSQERPYFGSSYSGIGRSWLLSSSLSSIQKDRHAKA